MPHDKAKDIAAQNAKNGDGREKVYPGQVVTCKKCGKNVKMADSTGRGKATNEPSNDTIDLEPYIPPSQ